MNRKLAFLLCAVILYLSTLPAFAVFSREDYYAMGIAALGEMTVEQVQKAVDAFEKAGSVGEAKNYKQYAQSLFEILQLKGGETPDLDMTGYRLQKLTSKQSFTDSLSENGLPSCDDLMVYIEAWRLESAGDFAGAWHLYEHIEEVLDAYDREFDLTDKAYEQGKAAYEKGDYAAAAAALKELEWKDSADLYHITASAFLSFDIQWDAMSENWDIMLNGHLRSNEIGGLLQDIERELEAISEYGLYGIRFRGVSFDDYATEGYDDGSGFLFLHLDLQPEEAGDAIIKLHSMLKDYYRKTWVFDREGIGSEISFNPNNETDLRYLLSKNDTFEIDYNPGSDKYNTTILLRYHYDFEERDYRYFQGITLCIPLRWEQS